ncbi:Protein kinase domain protein [compost metagenome]
MRLFDFGLGQADAGVLSWLAHLSRERFNAWTPGYAAPELLEHGTLGAAADMYAVACLIYELASGKHPYRRLPSTQARAEQLDRTLTRPSNLPAHCWPALKNALAFDPAQRTISARQLQEAMASKGGCWGRVFSLFKR